MAQGFKQEKKSSVKNYETIFEKIEKLTEGEEKPWTWYPKTPKPHKLKKLFLIQKNKIMETTRS